MAFFIPGVQKSVADRCLIVKDPCTNVATGSSCSFQDDQEKRQADKLSTDGACAPKVLYRCTESCRLEVRLWRLFAQWALRKGGPPWVLPLGLIGRKGSISEALDAIAALCPACSSPDLPSRFGASCVGVGCSFSGEYSAVG